MTTMLLAPDQVKPNPWQTRTSEDPAHIADLADSIRDVGLLQTPLARLRPHGEYAELAFGHSRLAAWKIAKPGEAFPVEIRALTDRQMSDLAAEENTRRKNLSAIETAKAIQKRIEDFGLTQLEAGAPFGYKSQGAVGNLLRLLKLPDVVQGAVAAGELPERHARELLLVSRLSPDAAAKIASDALQVDTRDRGEFVTKQISETLWSKGRRLAGIPFDLAWPKTPIKVENYNTAKGEPAEIPACTGCPFLFKHGHQTLCANPGCFDTKVRFGLAREVELASKRLKIPAAAGEKTVMLYDGNRGNIKALDDGYVGGRYQRGSERAKKLVRAQLSELRLVPLENSSWQAKELTGSEWVGLAATGRVAVDAWLSQAGGGEAAKAAAVAATLPRAEGAAQKAKRIEREEREAAERRADRANFQRRKYDTVWLMSHVSLLIAERTIGSHGLLRFAGEVVANRFTLTSGWDEVYEAERAIEAQIKGAVEKWKDLYRRQHLVFDVLSHNLTGYNRPETAFDWARAQREAEKVAKAFDVELPAGWNEPPVHHTPFNCWQCGRFASNNKLTKRDQAEGWTEERKGKELLGVYCPEHSKARQGKRLTEVFDDAAPAANGNGHKPAKSKKSKQLTLAQVRP